MYPNSEKSLGGQQRGLQATPYHKWDRIEKLAIRQGREGVTYRDVMREFGTSRKKAVTMLHNYEKKAPNQQNKGKLYSAGRTRPQRYYLTSKEAEFYYLQSTHIDHTGVATRDTRHNYNLNHQNNPLNRCVDYRPPPVSEEADSLLEAMLMSERALSASSIATHNPCITLELRNPNPDVDDPYDRIPDSYLAPGKEGIKNRTKLYRETVGEGSDDSKAISYRLSPSNTVTIYVVSSENPFPLSEAEHVDSILNFLEGRREVLRIWLSDRSDQFVPPVSEWRFSGLDINVDVGITPGLAFRMMNVKGGACMQVAEAERVFRDYVKKIKGRYFLRRERLLGRKGHPELALPATREALYGLMAEYAPVDVVVVPNAPAATAEEQEKRGARKS